MFITSQPLCLNIVFKSDICFFYNVPFPFRIGKIMDLHSFPSVIALSLLYTLTIYEVPHFQSFAQARYVD